MASARGLPGNLVGCMLIDIPDGVFIVFELVVDCERARLGGRRSRLRNYSCYKYTARSISGAVEILNFCLF